MNIANIPLPFIKPTFGNQIEDLEIVLEKHDGSLVVIDAEFKTNDAEDDDIIETFENWDALEEISLEVKDYFTDITDDDLGRALRNHLPDVRRVYSMDL